MTKEDVLWDHKIEDISCKQGSIDLTFTGNKLFNTDLVVGCDGIYSNVRTIAAKNDPALNYLGVMVILGICPSRHSLNKERIFQTSNGHGRFYSMPFLKDDPLKNTMWQFSVPIEHTQAL